MNLWIRSQNKKNLVEVSSIQIIKLNDSNKYALISYNDVIGDFNLGIYVNEERALEVLDEIQKILIPKIQVTSEFKKSDLTGNCNWIDKKEIMQFNTYVYEMPKE